MFEKYILVALLKEKIEQGQTEWHTIMRAVHKGGCKVMGNVRTEMVNQKKKKKKENPEHFMHNICIWF